MAKIAWRRVGAVVLVAGVLVAAGCVDGDHGRASYRSDFSSDYVYCGSAGGDLAALVVLGIYGVMLLVRAIVECG